MALRSVKYDDANAKYVITTDSTGSSWVDQYFDVGVGGQANFTVTQTFSSGSIIDVWVNGIKQRENASWDLLRNVPLNRIDFSYTVSQGSWVLVRVYV